MDDHIIGHILIGEAIEDASDPMELKGRGYFRVIGFMIDKKYRNQGIGTIALRNAMELIQQEYGSVALLLQCHQENVKALQFYQGPGFNLCSISKRTISI